jgi:hypothetical protein
MSDNNTQPTTTELFTGTLKTAALAEHLDIDMEDIEQLDNTTFEADGETYLVCTDGEAEERAGDYIKESLWAFNTGFIIYHSSLPYDATDMVSAFQEAKCEGANETIAALITDMDEFVEDAICADGRGHFLNGYDGEEYESHGFYIYQQ